MELEDGTVFRVPIERAHIEDDAGKNTHVGGADGRIEGADHSLVDYDKPTNGEGYLDVELEDGTVFRVPIERAHIEDDAGKNTHVGGADGRIEGADHSLVDYNRAGVPLIEIVTKQIEGAGDRAPEIAGAYMRAIRDIVRALNISHARMEQGNMRADVNVSLRLVTKTREGDGERAPEIDGAYMRAIRDIVRELNISHARMEQGNMRADVNVSLRRVPSDPFGTRSETKNVNSFRGIERTIQYEIRRQAAILDKGGEILQETRHWDEASQATAGGRVKSDADDYRYFPDPDLVMLHLTPEHVEEIRTQMPEMPRERRNRLKWAGHCLKSPERKTKPDTWHQFVPRHRTHDPVRDPPPGRDPRQGRRDPAGDSPLGRGLAGHRRRPCEVRRRRLPLLPGSGSGHAAHHARTCGRDPQADAGDAA